MTTTITDIAYEWGVREVDLYSWMVAVWDPTDRVAREVPFTEETARRAARNGYLYELKLVRRLPGCGAEVVAYEPAVLPIPTDADMHSTRVAGVMVCALGEDGEWVSALGHIHPADMAQAATLLIRDLCGNQSIEAFTKNDVEHVHAVRIEAWGSDCDWELRWERHDAPIASMATGAFPLTIVRANG